MSEVDPLSMLETAFLRMGAELPQARVMAAQLLKRARQVAAQREISETQALEELLQKVIAGRRGDYSGEVSGESDSASGGKSG